MRRSLRSRLIVGMLLGMAVLLFVASTTIYTVQRRQLYRAFDDTLLNSANSLTLLVHPSPFGNWFDAEGLAKLPAGRIHQGALYQLWSDQPIALPPPPNNLIATLKAFWNNQPTGEHPPRHDREHGEHEEEFMEPPRDGAPPPEERQDGSPPPKPPRDKGPSHEPKFRSRRPPPDNPSSEPSFEGPEPGPEPGPVRTTGSLVVRSPLLNGADLPRLDAPVGRTRFEKITLPDGTSGRAIGMQSELPSPPPEFRRSAPAMLTTVVAASTAEIEQQLRFLAALLLATAVGTMAVSGGVAWLVVTRGLRPLDQVAQKIAVMDETALKERIADCGIPLEIEPVLNQLNGLLARLDEAFDRERALTADVAHELRTPVAEIRAITEITLSRERDPKEYREALGETRDAIGTLQGLIEKLLILARLEAGQMKPELEAIALQPLVVEHWVQVCGRADPRGVRFDDLSSSDVMVSADPGLLDIVLTNVLSNAAAYTPDGGRISVETRCGGGRCHLTVANTGCRMGADEVARVFDRFWRADTARSKTGLNCGLGLTLVRRAMEAMGGTATAQVSQDCRFILTLAFTAADATTKEMNISGHDHDEPRSPTHAA